MPGLDLSRAARLSVGGVEASRFAMAGAVWAKPSGQTAIPSQFYLDTAPMQIVGASIVAISPNGVLIEFDPAVRSHVNWAHGLSGSRSVYFDAVSDMQAYFRFSTTADMAGNGGSGNTNLDGNPTFPRAGAKAVNVGSANVRDYFGMVVVAGQGGRIALSNFRVTNADGSI